MFRETHSSNYQSAVEVPAEIQGIHNPLVFKLSSRQFGFGLIGVIILGAATYLKINLGLHTIILIIAACLAAPFFAMGFLRPHNLDFEDFLSLYISNTQKTKPTRKLFAKNAYERALLLANSDKSKKQPNIRLPKKKQKSIYKFQK